MALLISHLVNVVFLLVLDSFALLLLFTFFTLFNHELALLLFKQLLHVLLECFVRLLFLLVGHPADVGSPKSYSIGNHCIKYHYLNHQPEVEQGSLDVAVLAFKEDHLSCKHSPNHVEVVESEQAT